MIALIDAITQAKTKFYCDHAKKPETLRIHPDFMNAIFAHMEAKQYTPMVTTIVPQEMFMSLKVQRDPVFYGFEVK